jgi:hypothetical protein
MKRPSERDGLSHGRDEIEFGDEKDEDEVEDEPSLLARVNGCQTASAAEGGREEQVSIDLMCCSGCRLGWPWEAGACRSMAPPRRTSGERARYVSFIFPDLDR